MYLKHLFLVMYFSCFALFLQAQKVRIIDENSNEGIPNTFLLGKENSAVGNEEGWVEINNLSKEENILIQHPNYQNKVVSYTQLTENKIVKLRESSVKLEEIVVSINRWEQNRKQVPVKYLSIQSPRETPWTNPQTTADLLGQSGEIFIQKSQLGGGSPMIRGFSANRLLIVIDGVRMNNAIFRGGNLQNIISLDANNLEEAEVIFGPGSVIYGSDALGGIMDFHTLQPRFSEEKKLSIKANAMMRYSSANNEKTGSFSLNLGTKKWAYAGSFSYSNFGDLSMGSNGGEESYLRNFYIKRINNQDQVIENQEPTLQRGSAFQQWSTLQKVRFKPNRFWEFQYGFIYSNTSEIPRYDRLIEFENGNPNAAEWYYGPQEWSMHNFQILFRPESLFFRQMRLTTAQQFYQESRNDRRLNDDRLRTRTESVDIQSINLDFDNPLNDNHSLFYGAEYIVNRVGSLGQRRNIVDGSITQVATRYPNGSTWQSWATYFSYQGNWSEKFTTTAGIRYNQVLIDATFDKTFYHFPFDKIESTNQAVNGSLGMVFRPTESWQINLQGASGFRSPNIDDVGKVFDSEPGNVVVPNPNLGAEYVWNLELGLIKNFRNFLQIEVNAFHSWLEDAVLRRDFQFAGQDSILYDGELSQVQALQNVASAKIYGIQSSILWDIATNWSFRSSLTYTQGKDNQGEAIRHVAPLFGQTTLTFRIEKFLAELSTVYNGEMPFSDLAPSERNKPQIYAQDGQGNPYSPAWAILNFKANYRLGNHLQISVGVENILDKQYRPYSSGIVAAGRNFIFSLRGNL